MKLTEAQRKALSILISTNSDKPFSCAGFAKKMWPDSPMHLRSKNTGNGSCTGKGAWLCAGSYLRKLEIRGWVRSHPEHGYYITSEGLKILRDTL